LENPSTEYTIDVTTLPIPESVTSKTAQILATKRDIAINEKADIHVITAENKIQRFFDYLHTASSLSVCDRLQTFWKYVLLYLTLTIAKFWPGKPFIFRHLQNVISTWKINQNFMSFCLMQTHLTQPTS
jgi:hypothetical protein